MIKKIARSLFEKTVFWKRLNGLRYKVRRRKEFRKDFASFIKMSKATDKRFALDWSVRKAYLFDNMSKTWFDRHYILHPSWAARILAETSPSKHIDVSSKLYFSTITSAFVPFEFYDYRPAEIELSNLKVGSEDLTNLSFDDNSVESISCMHTIEHIGLGRYGDPIDYDGDLKAVKELCRVVRPGGSLLVVVPVGRVSNIIFNAHRIYNSDEFISYFDGSCLKLRQYALIPEEKEDGDLVIDPPGALKDKQTYGCGCFWFVKNR